MGEFVTNVQEIRKRAREHMEKGAVTEKYGVDRDTSIRLLNEALATEIVCTLRYKSNAEAADGIHSETVAEEFREHAREEAEHADWISERVSQLGGLADYNPATLLGRSHSEFAQPETLLDMIKENLVAERIAIESYTEMVRFFGEGDPTSRRLLEKILAKEEEHADDMQKLMAHVRHTEAKRA
jgi:bacterioferritin